MRGRSLLKWASGLLQPAEKKKEGLLPDTPPPSYEEACFGLHGASQAVSGAPRPRHPRYLKIINGAMAQADCALERLKQSDDSIDIVDISSRIRQLCDFAAGRVTEHCQRLPNTNIMEERRHETISEISRLIRSVFATVDWELQDGISVVRIATTAFERTVCQILLDLERPNRQAHHIVLVNYRNYSQARVGLHVMLAGVLQTAGRMVERLDGYEAVAQSFLAVADFNINFAARCATVANL
ncbi:hypothetical protein PG985_003944 [Apiospora marii]|uniref:uncharacterized protein n=1 Tax=Apiospora marii TaxID=335849 RepID=UPI00312F9E19